MKPDGKESHEACQKKSRKRGKLRLTRHPDLVRHTHRHRAAGAHVPVRLLRDSVRLHAEHHRTGRPVITSKLTPKVFKLQRGDVVVFKDPDHWLQQENSGRFGGDYLIKRLIGLPGDTVACEGPGKPVTVNGVAIDETSYIRSGVDPSSFAFSEKVTAGHVFVMGDNRANSADSRYHQDDSSHGLVPVSDVVGVGLVKYWPLNHISTLDAHHDVFRDVPEGSAD